MWTVPLRPPSWGRLAPTWTSRPCCASHYRECSPKRASKNQSIKSKVMRYKTPTLRLLNRPGKSKFTFLLPFDLWVGDQTNSRMEAGYSRSRWATLWKLHIRKYTRSPNPKSSSPRQLKLYRHRLSPKKGQSRSCPLLGALWIQWLYSDVGSWRPTSPRPGIPCRWKLPLCCSHYSSLKVVVE